MLEPLDEIRTLGHLRAYLHKVLCDKESLPADRFVLSELPLVRRGRHCGLVFSLTGPRSVRLGAVWTADHGTVYLYDDRGVRYQKLQLRCRLLIEDEIQCPAA